MTFGQIYIFIREPNSAKPVRAKPHIHLLSECESTEASGEFGSVVKSYIFLIVTNSVSIAPLTNFKFLNPGVAFSLLI